MAKRTVDLPPDADKSLSRKDFRRFVAWGCPDHPAIRDELPDTDVAIAVLLVRSLATFPDLKDADRFGLALMQFARYALGRFPAGRVQPQEVRDATEHARRVFACTWATEMRAVGLLEPEVTQEDANEYAERRKVPVEFALEACLAKSGRRSLVRLLVWVRGMERVRRGRSARAGAIRRVLDMDLLPSLHLDRVIRYRGPTGVNVERLKSMLNAREQRQARKYGRPYRPFDPYLEREEILDAVLESGKFRPDDAVLDGLLVRRHDEVDGVPVATYALAGRLTAVRDALPFAYGRVPCLATGGIADGDGSTQEFEAAAASVSLAAELAEVVGVVNRVLADVREASAPDSTDRAIATLEVFLPWAADLLTADEVAERIGKHPSTVRRRLNRLFEEIRRTAGAA